MRFSIYLLFLGVLFASSAQAQSFYHRDAQVQIELVEMSKNDLDSNVGVEIIIQPGWSLSWLNPGDGGKAPVFKSNGQTVEPLGWPAPRKVKREIKNEQGETKTKIFYGYTQRVIFPFKMEPPVDLELTWSVCKDECQEGSAHLTFDKKIKALNQVSLADIREYPFPKDAPEYKLGIAEEEDGELVYELLDQQNLIVETKRIEAFKLKGRDGVVVVNRAGKISAYNMKLPKPKDYSTKMLIALLFVIIFGVAHFYNIQIIAWFNELFRRKTENPNAER